jgi:DNA replication initiation complex subunit (GINS family)
MANCPSAILGSTTTVADAPDGVILSITTTDPETRQRVRQLATLQANQGDPTPTEARHTGLHGGPGIEGHCPVIHDGTVVTATPTDNGVDIHVATTSPDRVQMLQSETRVRVTKTATIAHHP